MSKREEFNTALKNALKSKDKVAMSTVRLILAALKDRDIDARSHGQNEGITESEILSMLQSMVKQRRDSIKMYEEGGRKDLADREQAEINVIQEFLPRQLTPEELATALDEIISEIGATSVRDMGKVMAQLKAHYAGQIDMGKASGLVKERLG